MREIARNINAAAEGTAKGSATIVDVNREATSTGSAVSEMRASAEYLAEDTAVMRQAVVAFVAGVRRV